MPPDDRDLGYVWDILEAARLIQGFIDDMDRRAFERDAKTRFAVIAQLEIIGEATKRLSPEFRAKHPSVPWKQMAGMRDVLVHLYDRVDLGEVWVAASESVPALIEQLAPLLPPGDGVGGHPST